MSTISWLVWWELWINTHCNCITCLGFNCIHQSLHLFWVLSEKKSHSMKKKSGHRTFVASRQQQSQPFFIDPLNLQGDHLVDWLFLAKVASRTCFISEARWAVKWELVIKAEVRKMTHRERSPLICHRLYKGQGLGGRWANVINTTFLETPNWCTLVSGHEPSSASKCRADMIWNCTLMANSSIRDMLMISHIEYLLLEKCKLQGNLYEGIWTHLLLLDKFFPIIFEFENIHVEIIHQPEEENSRFLWLPVSKKSCTYL